jgi:hypothetical protein
MADQLLSVRDGTCVGNNWVERFIARRTEIKSQLS